MNIEVGDKVRVKWGFRNIKGKHIGVGDIPSHLQDKEGTVTGANDRCLNIAFEGGKNYHWTWDYNWVERITEDDEFRKLLIES